MRGFATEIIGIWLSTCPTLPLLSQPPRTENLHFSTKHAFALKQEPLTFAPGSKTFRSQLRSRAIPGTSESLQGSAWPAAKLGKHCLWSSDTGALAKVRAQDEGALRTQPG